MNHWSDRAQAALADHPLLELRCACALSVLLTEDLKSANEMYRRIIAASLSALALALSSHREASGVEVGYAAPNCSLVPVGKQQAFDLHRLRGKVIYVDFWASWCLPCVQSFPFMNNLDQEFREKGLQVVGINLDQRPDDAQRFLGKYPATFTVAFDAGGMCPQDFGVRGMPSSYMIDRKGIVRHAHVGFRRGEAEKLRGMVEDLLGEEAAQHQP